MTYGTGSGTVDTRPAVVVGVDAGGTSTRCTVATPGGAIVGRGASGGGNLRSVRDPGTHLVEALRGALRGVDPGRVAAGVLGMAGAGSAGREQAERLARRAWAAVGLPGGPVVIPDLAVAFAAATEAPDGTVLIAGTGAVSALVRDRRAVRRCDGYGWLVGDEGSGVWIGQQAVRAVLGALDGRREPTLLVDDLPEALLGPDCDRAAIAAQGREALAQAVIAAVYDAEPARLAVLAPVVERAAAQGDVTARRILGEAARSLVCSARALGQDHPAEPFVLSGSLLTAPTLLAELVRTGLTERREAPVLTALDGAAGAAALALRAAPRLHGGEEALRRAHRRLINPVAPGRAVTDAHPRAASVPSFLSAPSFPGRP